MGCCGSVRRRGSLYPIEQRERPFSILDRRGIFQFKGDNVPQIHRRGVDVDVYEFRSLGRASIDSYRFQGSLRRPIPDTENV